jgi:glycosyltransferase involved in cell wall biosynthesis
VVHNHLIHANLYGALAAWPARIPAIASQHDALPALTRIRYRPLAMATRLLSARTIAISEHVRAFVTDQRLARPGSVRLIPYGIEADRWTPGDGARERARQRFSIEPGAFVITSASALIPGKGHAMLIGAVGDLAERHRGVRLLIAGDGPQRRALERAAREGAPSCVRFLGWVDEVDQLLAATDVLAIPTEASLGEGFGMIAVEAMAAGVPVVATAVGALPEVVADGTSGIVVAPSQVGLRHGLGVLIDDEQLRARLAVGAVSIARGFDIDAVVRATIEVYRELT